MLLGNLLFVVGTVALIILFFVDEQSKGFMEWSYETKVIVLASVVTIQLIFVFGCYAWLRIGQSDDANEILETLYKVQNLDFEERIKVTNNLDKEHRLIYNSFNQVIDEFNYNWKNLNLELSDLKSEFEQVKKNQEDVIETEKMASLGRLVAGVSHEINTPLGIAVTGMTHLQTQKVKTEELLKAGKISAKDLKLFLHDADKSIELVLNQVYLAADLIKNFKQIAVDQTSPVTREIILSDYIEKVISTVQPLFKRSPYKLVVSKVVPVSIVTCPGALSQVITILVQNALKHAFEDRNVGFVYIEIETTDKKVLIVVKDDGTGIPVSHRKKIFEPFYTTKRGKGGSGLGLSLAYNICKEVLLGKLFFRANDQGGSDFVIQIPKDRELHNTNVNP